MARFGWCARRSPNARLLLRIAPHVVQPLRLVLPVSPVGRPAWMLRLGLFLYDRLGGRRVLPGTQRLDLTHHELGVPLQRRYRSGFAFSDCWVDDARLVVLNALDAAERGATIRTRTKVVRAEREGEWRLILNVQGRRDVATARVLVNAAGPWVGSVAETILRLPGRPPVRLVKGSHIVVRRLFDHESGYLFQNDDGRIVFALPFGEGCTLIGTTDEDFAGDLDAVAPSAQEVLYLCRAVSAYFRQSVAPEDVVAAFAGVRSLHDTLHDNGARRPEAVTRDYHLTLDERFREAPLLTIYGGKITTYRRLADPRLRDSRITSTERTANGPGILRCLEAIFRGTASTNWRTGRAGTGHSWTRHRRIGSCGPTGRGSTACWANQGGLPRASPRSAR